WVSLLCYVAEVGEEWREGVRLDQGCASSVKEVLTDNRAIRVFSDTSSPRKYSRVCSNAFERINSAKCQPAYGKPLACYAHNDYGSRRECSQRAAWSLCPVELSHHGKENQCERAISCFSARNLVFPLRGGDGSGRGLVQRRKEVGWFRRRPLPYTASRRWGDTSSRYGLTGVGVIPHMMNVNMTLDTQDLALGRRAAALRASLPAACQAMFPHEGQIEVACNVDLLPAHLASVGCHTMRLSLGGQYMYARTDVIEGRVLKEAGGVGVVGRLIGFTPRKRALAIHAPHGQAEAWRNARERGCSMNSRTG
ncbi:hypothetical protein Hamer_G027593, partial [Homarus americanus]